MEDSIQAEHPLSGFVRFLLDASEKPLSAVPEWEDPFGSGFLTECLEESV